MRKGLRLVLVSLGLAVAVYGTASLTGGWLGFPLRREFVNGEPETVELGETKATIRLVEIHHDGGEALGVGFVATGLALATFAAWPRRARPTPPE